MPEVKMIFQQAPWPEELEDIITHLVYRPGWTFELKDTVRGQESEGLTLDIVTKGFNAYHLERGETYSVHHYMIVPAASYDRQSWMRWVFEQLVLVERHEAMEFFTLVYEAEGGYVLRDGSHSDTHTERPYSPNHGPGNNPYDVRELTTDKARRTSFRGDVNA